MHTYKSIAVGTDGSATSMVAVRAAASLARVYGAELTIICAHYTASGSMLNSTNAELSRVDIVTATNAREILRKADEIAKEEQAGKVNLVSRAASPRTCWWRPSANTALTCSWWATRACAPWPGASSATSPATWPRRRPWMSCSWIPGQRDTTKTTGGRLALPQTL